MYVFMYNNEKQKKMMKKGLGKVLIKNKEQDL